MSFKTAFTVLLFAASAVGASAAVAADTHPGLRIGVVNTSVLLQKSPQAQNATSEMSKKFDSRKKDLMAEQEKIKTMQDDLSRNGATLSAAQAQQEQSQLDDLQRDFSRKSSDFQDDVNMARNAALSTLQQDVLKAVQEFAQAQKYNLVLAEGVLYNDATVDVTDQVLAQMDKDYKASAGGTKSGD